MADSAHSKCAAARRVGSTPTPGTSAVCEPTSAGRLGGVLRIDDDGRVRVLTLDRPDALNSFNNALYDAVRHALDDAAGDPGVAVVVITGSGPKAFSSGNDLGEMVDPPHYDDGEEHGFPPFIRRVASFPKPLLAAVNGLGVGIGCTLLPHCDIVLLAAGARLRAPFTALGVVPEAASTVLFPAAMGWQATAEFLFTSRWMSAEEAVANGLARRVVPAESLMGETMALAQEIAAMPITSLMRTKELLLEARGDLTPVLDREFKGFVGMVGAPANAEAIAAFREKRAPDFSKL